MKEPVLADGEVRMFIKCLKQDNYSHFNAPANEKGIMFTSSVIAATMKT
jgi:hypothetical protein